MRGARRARPHAVARGRARALNTSTRTHPVGVKGELGESLNRLHLAVMRATAGQRAARSHGLSVFERRVADESWPAGPLPLLARAARLLAMGNEGGMPWYAATAALDRVMLRKAPQQRRAAPRRATSSSRSP